MKSFRVTHSHIVSICAMTLMLLVFGYIREAVCETINFEQALDIALNRSSQGEMIRGNLEVAEQNYFARRINFYLPEISINGSVPSYNEDESYRFFGGATEKRLYKTRVLEYSSFIALDQSLIIGGDIRITANLLASDDRYPDTKTEAVEGSFINETTRLGDFTFSYTQPILKPSDSKHELHNKRDDLEIARMTKHEDASNLKKEVIEAYFGVLQLILKNEMHSDMLESANLTAAIDSMKFLDGVISEEDWLTSKSNRLEAELQTFEVSNELDEKRRELAILLDKDPDIELEPTIPAPPVPLSDTKQEIMLSSIEKSVPVRKAELDYSKADRQAKYAASSHGLNGDLTASYNTGQGEVETDGVTADIVTRGWEVALEFTYPIWDGGASGADVKSARLTADQALLEYNRTLKSTKAEVINLIDQLDVGYRRLEIIRKQIDLAFNKLDIAKSRLDDGQISMVTFLASKITYAESRDKYLDELKNYLLNEESLDGKFRREG